MTRHKREAEMTATKQLIDDAKEAEKTAAAAKDTLSLSQQQAADAASDLTAKNQAVCDDLNANGPALYIEEVEGETKYSLATAAPPSTYTLVPLRVA